MFKEGKSYIYRGIVIAPSGYGYHAHFKYADDNGVHHEVDLTTDTIPELLRLIDLY